MKNSNKREETISTGKKLIIEKGFLNTSVEDITKKMGIAKGSFYTYFKSKDEFILAIISEKIFQRRHKVNEILEKELSFEETIKEFLAQSLSFPLIDTESFLIIMNLFKNINLLSENVKISILDNTKLGNHDILKILNKYKDKLDLSDENDIDKYAYLIKAFINSFYENSFNPLMNFEKKESHITISEIEDCINKINLEKEINFMTKAVIKLILK